LYGKEYGYCFNMISCLVGKLSSKVKKALESSKPAAMAFLTGVDLEGRVQERSC
jgi:hypothetical protein